MLLLFGLQRTTGIAGSLLLNLEAPLTLVLAIGLFGEHLQARLVVAAASVFAGAAFVTADPGRSYATVAGALAIGAACLAWAIDNNVTQRLSSRDPLRLAQVKTGAATAGLGLISVVSRSRFPTARFAACALVAGAIGYGVSIVLDVHALRLLGAAREAVLFATAPFVGAIVAIVLLSERPTPGIGVGAVLMVLGVATYVSERHEHPHAHAPIEHEHVHEHDAHHAHEHDPASLERHSHPHLHQETQHAHPHASDVHHRHGH
jgi:drug/metabolite transporter (DMT)-like permease